MVGDVGPFNIPGFKLSADVFGPDPEDLLLGVRRYVEIRRKDHDQCINRCHPNAVYEDLRAGRCTVPDSSSDAKPQT